MPQTTLIVAGTTAVTSAPTTVADGAAVTVAVFPTGADTLTLGEKIELFQTTPGGNVLLGSLSSGSALSLQVFGPITFIVKRPVLHAAFGVSLDT